MINQVIVNNTHQGFSGEKLVNEKRASIAFSEKVAKLFDFTVEIPEKIGHTLVGISDSMTVVSKAAARDLDFEIPYVENITEIFSHTVKGAKILNEGVLLLSKKAALRDAKLKLSQIQDPAEKSKVFRWIQKQEKELNHEAKLYGIESTATAYILAENVSTLFSIASKAALILSHIAWIPKIIVEGIDLYRAKQDQKIYLKWQQQIFQQNHKNYLSDQISDKKLDKSEKKKLLSSSDDEKRQYLDVTNKQEFLTKFEELWDNSLSKENKVGFWKEHQLFRDIDLEKPVTKEELFTRFISQQNLQILLEKQRQEIYENPKAAEEFRDTKDWIKNTLKTKEEIENKIEVSDEILNKRFIEQKSMMAMSTKNALKSLGAYKISRENFWFNWQTLSAKISLAATVIFGSASILLTALTATGIITIGAGISSIPGLAIIGVPVILFGIGILLLYKNKPDIVKSFSLITYGKRVFYNTLLIIKRIQYEYVKVQIAKAEIHQKDRAEIDKLQHTLKKRKIAVKDLKNTISGFTTGFEYLDFSSSLKNGKDKNTQDLVRFLTQIEASNKFKINRKNVQFLLKNPLTAQDLKNLYGKEEFKDLLQAIKNNPNRFKTWLKSLIKEHTLSHLLATSVEKSKPFIDSETENLLKYFYRSKSPQSPKADEFKKFFGKQDWELIKLKKD